VHCVVNGEFYGYKAIRTSPPPKAYRSPQIAIARSRFIFTRNMAPNDHRPEHHAHGRGNASLGDGVSTASDERAETWRIVEPKWQAVGELEAPTGTWRTVSIFAVSQQ
jgi:hypothetical protein